MREKFLDKHISYEIKINGQLQGKWTHWLDDAMIQTTTTGEGKIYSTITVAIPDQAALRGLLNKIWDLNLTLISLVQKVQLHKE